MKKYSIIWSKGAKKSMNKKLESLEAVYIYIYIVSFNKTSLCKHRKLCVLVKPKMHSFFVMIEIIYGHKVKTIKQNVVD